jgi:Ca-activated chloride channel family protein
MANRGVTDAAGLRQIAAKARADGIGVSTLGCGTEFNEKRLRDLAEAGQGRYTYIQTPEQIPTAFEQEMQGLLKPAAQNVRLEITVNNGGAITRVNGLALDQPVPSQSFNIGNVRAGEHGLFLVEVKPSSFASGANIDMITRLTYDDPQTAQRNTSEIGTQTLLVSEGEVREDAGIVLHGKVLDALVAAEEAAKGLDTERYKQAQAGVDSVYERAHQFALENKNQELLNETFLLKHFMEEFTLAAKQGILHSHREARTKFEKEADYRRYLLQHHRVQGAASHSVHD